MDFMNKFKEKIKSDTQVAKSNGLKRFNVVVPHMLDLGEIIRFLEDDLDLRVSDRSGNFLNVRVS